MSAIAHFVFDDYVQGVGLDVRGGMASRVGSLVAQDDGLDAHRPLLVDAYMNRLPESQPAKTEERVSDEAWIGLATGDQTIANTLVPQPLTNPVRTYELIVRNFDNRTVVNCQSNIDGTVFKVSFNGSISCLVHVQNPDEDSATFTIGGVTFDADAYHHVCVVFDTSDPVSKTATLYVDGELVGSDTKNIDLSGWDSLFVTPATDLFRSDASTHGNCEMMVHDVALTATEIKNRSFYMRACNALQFP